MTPDTTAPVYTTVPVITHDTAARAVALTIEELSLIHI